MPDLPEKAPKTIVEGLDKIIRMELAQYRNPDRIKGWPVKSKMMLGKYLYIHSRIYKKAFNPNFKPQWRPMGQYQSERMQAAAQELDREREEMRTPRGKPLSFDQWIKHLKETLPAENGGSKKRKSRDNGFI